MTVQAPQIVESDARNRAVRTFLQGLGLDVAVAVVVVLASFILVDVQWTATYWLALGLALSKTVVQSIVAYFVRKLVPPATAAEALAGRRIAPRDGSL